MITPALISIHFKRIEPGGGKGGLVKDVCVLVQRLGDIPIFSYFLLGKEECYVIGISSLSLSL
jgi:hypothetical protein